MSHTLLQFSYFSSNSSISLHIQWSWGKVQENVMALSFLSSFMCLHGSGVSSLYILCYLVSPEPCNTKKKVRKDKCDASSSSYFSFYVSQIPAFTIPLLFLYYSFLIYCAGIGKHRRCNDGNWTVRKFFYFSFILQHGARKYLFLSSLYMIAPHYWR